VCKHADMAHLKEYLTRTKTPQARLADEINVTYGYMSQLVNGAKMPSLTVALLIERATDGAVSASSWGTSEARQ
jgi:DNA-binding transcriptional regulator YdaS (Cro superfamily)